MTNSYTHIEQVRNVLEVLRLASEVNLTAEQVERIRQMAYQYLDELLPARIGST